MFLIKFIFGIISHKIINFFLLKNQFLLNDPNHLSQKNDKQKIKHNFIRWFSFYFVFFDIPFNRL